VDSIPQAVDIVLKACFAFDVKYAVAAQSSWTFVQRAIYNLKNPDDVVSSRVSELLTEVGC